jgi:hypothetical protein
MIMRTIFFFILILFFLESCTKFVKVPDPPTQIDRSDVFSNDESATSAVFGIYSSMMEDLGMASANTSIYSGLSADELTFYSSDAGLGQFYSNAIIPSNPDLTTYWGNAYQYIYGANSVIEGLSNNNKVTLSVKQQLTGEAKFIRAFCYFYLANLFGDVPLILSTDYVQNAVAHRTTRNLVFDQIYLDFSDAENMLSINYLQADNTPFNERIRPNKWAATAMLARVNLFSGNWDAAIAKSSEVISQSGTYNLVYNLDSTFLANSNEAIWQLKPVIDNFNSTWEGFVYILHDAPSGSLGVSLSNELANSFEPGDQRRIHWVDSITVSGFTYYFAFKYKLSSSPELTEYYMMLRLSEQYLIRAEARARTGDLSGAIGDLNIIRLKAGLFDFTAADLTSILDAIQKERRFELFSEWGYRWLDLKRTGTANEVLSDIKSPGWQETDTLYPIPQSERQNDPNLTQNPNY